MRFTQDDEDSFLTDKKIEERIFEHVEVKRRGGAYVNENQSKKSTDLENEDEEKYNVFNTVIMIIAVIVVIIAIFAMIKIFGTLFKSEENDIVDNVNQTQNDTLNNSINNNTNSNTNNNITNSSLDKDSDNSKLDLSIASMTETYDAYPIEIESVVYKKGGNFYNNNEKIKGDKVYVEYKQINGLKDTKKQNKINEMLKEISIELYDKNYLSDENTLFVDIYTKLSINFNTLSYIVYRTGEDIDGIRFGETIKTLNISLDTLEEIKFEELFVDNTNIKDIYKDYAKENVSTFYFDPQTIYIYDEKLEETKIDMSKNYEDIAIYKRYISDEALFKNPATIKKVFNILDSTISEETKDRAFEKNT